MISILVPTWGRPRRLEQMVASVFGTAAQPKDIEVLVRVSEEDPCSAIYFAEPPSGAKMHATWRAQTYGKGIEFLQQKAAGEILFAGSDDILFRTDGWDDQVRAAFAAAPDQLLVAYANNGLNREKCEHFFTSRRWIDTVGYMVWPEFRHFCVDQWVEELASGVGRLQFLRDVVAEHCHRKYRKAPDDETYQLVRGDTRTSELDNELYRARGEQRAEALARLQAAMT